MMTADTDPFEALTARLTDNDVERLWAAVDSLDGDALAAAYRDASPDARRALLLRWYSFLVGYERGAVVSEDRFIALVRRVLRHGEQREQLLLDAMADRTK